MTGKKTHGDIALLMAKRFLFFVALYDETTPSQPFPLGLIKPRFIFILPKMRMQYNFKKYLLASPVP